MFSQIAPRTEIKVIMKRCGYVRSRSCISSGDERTQRRFEMATTIATHEPMGKRAAELTPGRALRYAWYGYLVLLACPFLLFLYAIWDLQHDGLARNIVLSDRWFITAVAYMVIVVPISFFVRSRFFLGYWR